MSFRSKKISVAETLRLIPDLEKLLKLVLDVDDLEIKVFVDLEKLDSEEDREGILQSAQTGINDR